MEGIAEGERMEAEASPEKQSAFDFVVFAENRGIVWDNPEAARRVIARLEAALADPATLSEAAPSLQASNLSPVGPGASPPAQ